MKKIVYIFFPIIIVAITICCTIIFSNKKNNENLTNENTITIDTSFSGEKITTIKSSSNNPIKKDNIEATSIEIFKDVRQLRVESTLKNTSDTVIDGFFIEIALIDKNGNTVTTVSKDSKQKIDANSSYLFATNIVDLNNASDIVNAKIVSLDSNTQNSIENAFYIVEN